MENFAGIGALRVFLTSKAGYPKIGEQAYSLGGQATEYEERTLKSLISDPIKGVVLDKVFASNTSGVGYISAASSDSLMYMAPGDTDYGSAVTIADGETKILQSQVGFFAIQVTRDGADDLAGFMTLTIVPCYNNVISMGRVVEADRSAGADFYRALMLRNMSNTDTITNVKVWGSSATLQAQAYETPSSGEIQEVADEKTVPSGLSWNTGTSASAGLLLASLAPLASHGLWLKRVITAGVAGSAETDRSVYVRFTVGGNTYTLTLGGKHHIEQTALDKFLLHIGEDEFPDFSAAEDASSATLPFTHAITPPVSGTKTFRCTVLKRNPYNLKSLNRGTVDFILDDDGDEVTPELRAPERTAVENWSGGYVKVKSFWSPVDNEEDPADEWRIYYTTDGTDPDPEVDTPIELDFIRETSMGDITFPMFGDRYTLDYGLGPYEFGTEVRVIVRAFRSDDDAESENTTVVTQTVDTHEPGQSIVDLFIGSSYAVANAEDDVEILYIDEEKNIYWEISTSSISLWADEVLVWVLYPDQLRTTFDQDTTGSLFGAPGTDPIDIGDWNGTRELWITANGDQVCKLDITNQVMEYMGGDQVATVDQIHDEIPVKAEATKTHFQIYDPSEGQYVTAFTFDGNGIWNSAVHVVQCASEAECFLRETFT